MTGIKTQIVCNEAVLSHQYSLENVPISMISQSITINNQSISLLCIDSVKILICRTSRSKYAKQNSKTVTGYKTSSQVKNRPMLNFCRRRLCWLGDKKSIRPVQSSPLEFSEMGVNVAGWGTACEQSRLAL